MMEGHKDSTERGAIGMNENAGTVSNKRPGRVYHGFPPPLQDPFEISNLFPHYLLVCGKIPCFFTAKEDTVNQIEEGGHGRLSFYDILPNPTEGSHEILMRFSLETLDESKETFACLSGEL
jgi:hypothetical protein